MLLATASHATQRGGPLRTGPPAAPEAAHPGSKVQYKVYPSALMNRELRYGVYLPPSYETSNRRYPVLYFLHGLGENEMRWSTRGEGDAILEQMLAGKE